MSNLLTNMSEFVTRVRNTINDNPSASTDRMISSDVVIETMVRSSVEEFSKYWPRRRAADITAVNSQYDYSIATYLTGWRTGWSWIKELEFPQGEQDPSRYRKDNFIIYNNEYLRILIGTPGSTDTIRVIYYTPHEVTSASSSIPESFEESVALYASGLCNILLAQRFAKASNPDLKMDVVSYRTKSDVYLTLAKNLKEMAKQVWGKGDLQALGTRAYWNWYETDYGDYTEYRED